MWEWGLGAPLCEKKHTLTGPDEWFLLSTNPTEDLYFGRDPS
jgi:hypothetical protein